MGCAAPRAYRCSGVTSAHAVPSNRVATLMTPWKRCEPVRASHEQRQVGTAMHAVMHDCVQHIPRWSSRGGPTDETRQAICHVQGLAISARKADSVLLNSQINHVRAVTCKCFWHCWEASRKVGCSHGESAHLGLKEGGCGLSLVFCWEVPQPLQHSHGEGRVRRHNHEARIQAA